VRRTALTTLLLVGGAATFAAISAGAAVQRTQPAPGALHLRFHRLSQNSVERVQVSGVERLVDWEMVRETARPFYSDFGRPGVDPVVLVKVFLVAVIRGSDSMRETLRVARVDLSVRRFLGYGLTEALPHHATFSYAQCVRFADQCGSRLLGVRAAVHAGARVMPRSRIVGRVAVDRGRDARGSERRVEELASGTLRGRSRRRVGRERPDRWGFAAGSGMSEA
jgi:hypothetical protein